jgi:hypothetical protein
LKETRAEADHQGFRGIGIDSVEIYDMVRNHKGILSQVIKHRIFRIETMADGPYIKDYGYSAIKEICKLPIESSKISTVDRASRAESEKCS